VSHHTDILYRIFSSLSKPKYTSYLLPVSALQLIAVDGHRHTAGATTGAGQFAGGEGDDTTVVVVDADASFGDILSIEDAEAGAVEGVDCIGIATVADDFARSQGKEVGATVPLLALLVPEVVAATEDGFHLDAGLLEGLEHIFAIVVLDLATVNFDAGGAFASKLIGFAQHRLVHHTAVAIQESVDHIEVDERVGLVGQLLDDDIEFFAVAERIGQKFNTFSIGADTFAYAEQIAAAYLHIAAFGAGRGVPFLCIDDFGSEKVLENSLVNQVLTFADIERHRVDEDAVEDRRRGVAGEEKVVERSKSEAALGEALGVLARAVREALDEFASDGFGVLRHHLVDKEVAILSDAALPYKRRTERLVIKKFLKDIADIKHFSNFFEDTAEPFVFVVDNVFAEDVAVECLVSIGGGHPFDFGARPMQQHGVETSYFGGDVDFY